jgi:hypothetical protein
MRASIVVPVPSRVIWTTPVPRRATLRVMAGVLPSDPPAVVRFRAGVSDHRIYEGLAELTVPTRAGAGSGWVPMDVDLSAYAGRKWSIFYRPDTLVWRLVLSTDAIDGEGVRALWGEPAIEADLGAARHFVKYRLARPPGGQ